MWYIARLLIVSFLTFCTIAIGPRGPELIWYLATKYKMNKQQLVPAVYHHVNHDKQGWVEWAFRLNLAKLDFLLKVTMFSNFGLQDDLK